MTITVMVSDEMVINFILDLFLQVLCRSIPVDFHSIFPSSTYSTDFLITNEILFQLFITL